MRRRLDNGGRLWAELRDPRQHDVPDRAGYLVRAVREKLCDVERVARRESPDGVDVNVAALGEPGNAVAGEGPHREPLDRGRGREISERDAERVGAAELVVAVGDDGETGGFGVPPAEQPQHVHAPCVRPVRVLDDDDERLPVVAELQKPGGDVVCRGPRVEHPVDRTWLQASAISRNGPRGRGVTSGSHPPPEDRRRVRQLLAEPADERRLADARLTADEDEAASAGLRRREGLVELRLRRLRAARGRGRRRGARRLRRLQRVLPGLGHAAGAALPPPRR